MTPRSRVLLVPGTDAAAAALADQGHRVLRSARAGEALALLQHRQVHLVVLDAQLPDLTGLDLLRALRSHGRPVPAVLVAPRHDLQLTLTAFDLGAYDVVEAVAPAGELVARVAAVLRRTTASSTSTRTRCGEVDFEDDGNEIYADGESLGLTRTEYRLLHYLLDNAGVTVPKDRIADEVWDTDIVHRANVVELSVSSVRRKLGPHADLLSTVRGHGYRMLPAASPRYLGSRTDSRTA